MAIITISRGSYSRGKAVSEKLAAKLGYECISRDVLLEASDEFNIPEIKLIRALHDAPSVLERFTFGKERYINYFCSALLQKACSDNIVYHGLAGHYFLRAIPHVLKVRIIADMEDRVREEMRRENISAEKALYTLKKDDEERRKWGLQLYGMDTWDSRLYDIVLHIHKLTVEDAVEILRQAALIPAFQSTPQSRRLVENLALAAKAKARLALLAPKIHVNAEDGHLHLHPPSTSDSAWLERIKHTAAQIEGVKEVHIDATPPREQHDHINPFHNIG